MAGVGFRRFRNAVRAAMRPCWSSSFEIVSVALALVVEGDRLMLLPCRWSCLGLPLPRSLLPRGTNFKTERAGAFCFGVAIALPLIGLIVGYSAALGEVGAG